MRMQCMNDSNDVLCALNDAIWYEDADSRDFIDGEDKRLLNYYKAYKITSFDADYHKVDNKQEVIDIIKRISLRHITNIKYKLCITFLGSLRNLRNSNSFYGSLPLS